MGSASGGVERWFGVTSFFGLGLVAGVVLLFVLWIVLPAQSRSRLAPPAILLGVHLALEAVGFFLPKGAVAVHPVRVLAALALLLALGRGSFVLVADGIFAGRLGRPLPRIFRDILQSVVYSGVVLVTLRIAGVELGSLLTTSALLTAVIGLSLQDTLGNLFAGISIQMQRPFEVGDFIQFDPDAKLIGRVIEINWRATTVLTNDEMEVIVPNGTLAKAPIRNYTKPSLLARRSVEVSCAYDVAPERVRATILAAIAGVPEVLPQPAPTVLTWSFGASGVDYAVRYFTDSFALRDATDAAVRERIWYALRRAEIAVPYPRQEVHLHQATTDGGAHARAQRAEEVEKRLRQIDFLAVLPSETLARLSGMVPTKVYAPRELILRQGEPGEAMFLILGGEVSVVVGRDNHSSAEVARLRSGGLFGEMSLMTGEPRSATVQAVTETELAVVGKDAFAAILADAPELAQKVTRVLVERQAELESHLVARAARAARPDREVLDARTNALLARVRNFFQLRG